MRTVVKFSLLFFIALFSSSAFSTVSQDNLEICITIDTPELQDDQCFDNWNDAYWYLQGLTYTVRKDEPEKIQQPSGQFGLDDLANIINAIKGSSSVSGSFSVSYSHEKSTGADGSTYEKTKVEVSGSASAENSSGKGKK